MQEYLASSGFRFLDWTPLFARAIGARAPRCAHGPFGAAEVLSMSTLSNELSQHVLSFDPADDAFVELQNLQRSIRGEYDDDLEPSLARLLNSLQDAFFRLSAAIEPTALRKVNAVLNGAREVYHAQKRCWASEIQATSLALSDALRTFVDALSEVNPKADCVRTLVARSSSPFVLCPADQIGDVQLEFPTAKVCLPTCMEKGMEALIGAAWLGERQMLRTFLPPPATETHLVLYSWEKRCLERQLSRRGRLAQQHWSNSRIVVLPAPENEAGVVSGSAIAEPEGTTDELPDTDAWLTHARAQRARALASDPTFSGEKSVEARLHLLGSEHYVFYTPGHGVIRLEDPTKRETSESRAVAQVPACDLRVGDLVVESTNGSRDLIRESADQHLPAGLRQLARMWRPPLVALRQELGSDAALHRRLQDAGCGRVCATLRSWLQSDYLIGPQEREDLDIIAKVTGADELTNRLDDVFAAIRGVRAEHLRAAARLQRQLESRISEHLSDGSGITEALVVEEGVLVLRIESRHAEVSRVAPSQVNHVRQL